MDFAWTDDQRELVAAAGELAVRLERIEPVGGDFSPAMWQECAKAGLLGLAVPEEYGGSGHDALTTVAVLEELGFGTRHSGLIFSANAQMWACQEPILRFGSAGQRTRFLPRLCDGSVVGGHAATEAAAGSDALAVETTAERRDGGWVLSGTKTFVTNGPVAGVFVVSARTAPSKGFGGLSAFLVERDRPGVVVGPPFAKMGLAGSPVSTVTLSDCFLDDDALLGRVGGGFAVLRATMRVERSMILASALGAMRYALDKAVEFAATRRQFGRAIGEFQAVSHRIVDMKLRLDSARLMLYRLAWLTDLGRATDGEAAAVKLYVSEAFCDFSLLNMQVYGGAGYLSGTGADTLVADALASRAYSGTSDIQATLVARDLGL